MPPRRHHVHPRRREPSLNEQRHAMLWLLGVYHPPLPGHPVLHAESSREVLRWTWDRTQALWKATASSEAEVAELEARAKRLCRA